MYQMFHQANAFNQDIGCWNVGKVTNMSLMFAYIYTFSYLANIPMTNVLVERACIIKHPRHISYLTHIPMANVLIKGICTTKHPIHIGAFNQDIGSWNISSLTNATDMFYNNTMMSIANMDNTLRGWAKLDTAAGETAIQSNVINIPTTNVLVEGVYVSKH
jgi:hypothetical protein